MVYITAYIEKKNSVCNAYINSMGICNLTSIPWECVMLTSIPWEWWVVGTNLANIEPNRNSHDLNVHVINLLP